MAQQRIIRRTEKIRHLKELLRERNNVYLSSFLYTGKSVLLSQLVKSLSGKVLQWNAGAGGFADFERKVNEEPECTVIIDSLDQIESPETADALAIFLANLPAGKNAVLAGRDRMPAFLNNLCTRGAVVHLGPDFLLFTEEEINQLFLEYGISLSQENTAQLRQFFMGWPVVMHTIARMMLEKPTAPLASFKEQICLEYGKLFIQEKILPIPEQERTILFNLAPFPRFSGALARMLCGRTDAARMIHGIISRSYCIDADTEDDFSFHPLAQKALFQYIKNIDDQEYINGQYRRAALYYELLNQVSLALRYYILLNDTTKIKELLIRETYVRPSNSDLTELRAAYDHLPEEMILSSPELIRGKSMLESLQGRPAESERWYQELVKLLQLVPAKDAINYLDLSLPHRGTKNILNLFISFSQMKSMLESRVWRSGFNVAGNNVSLINGGKDFCRWVPHRRLLYQWSVIPIETVLGASGNGVGELAYAESELESNLDGDLSSAMEHACRGLSLVSDDLEMECVAVGIQSRILCAQANAGDAVALIRHREASLPPDAPILRQQKKLALLLPSDGPGGQSHRQGAWFAGGIDRKAADRRSDRENR